MFDTFFWALLLALILSTPTTEEDALNHPKPRDNGNNDPNTDTSIQQVQWQTAFWCLVSLAVLTMSQPCGKVCTLPSRYRIYLRSSPMLCAADTLSIIVRWTAISIHLRVSPIRALRLLQRDRFEHREEAEGLQNLGSSTFGRWIFTVLGPLPVMIKMASFIGTPWTKVYAACYIASFVTTEFIIVTTPKDVHERRLDPDMPSPRISLPKWLKAFDLVLLVLAQLPHAMTFLLLQMEFLTEYMAIPFLDRYFGEEFYGGRFDKFPPFVVGLTLSSGATLSSIYLSRKLFNAMTSYCNKHPAVGKWLVLVFPESEGSTQLVVDGWAIWALFFFLGNVITALLGYRFLYDSTSTINPSWTTIFG
jgi:hypothetical protein